MVFTNYGRSGNTLLWAGSADKPEWCAIGSGSGAELAAVGSLFAEVLSERKQFTTRDISVANETTWTFDFSSTTMSGIELKEFGLAGSAAKNSQTLWTREGLANAITFNGSNELQVQIILRTVQG